jgi:hypothetical protein
LALGHCGTAHTTTASLYFILWCKADYFCFASGQSRIQFLSTGYLVLYGSISFSSQMPNHSLNKIR